MQLLIAFNLWTWIEEHRRDFEPPVGNKMTWEDSPFTAMIIRGPHARCDFHVDPSDELFDRLTGNMILDDMHDGQRQAQVIRAGECLLVLALMPHSPHRPADTKGLEDVFENAYAGLGISGFLYRADGDPQGVVRPGSGWVASPL